MPRVSQATSSAATPLSNAARGAPVRKLARPYSSTSEAVRPVVCRPATTTAVAKAGLWSTESLNSAGADSTGSAASKPAARKPRHRSSQTMASAVVPVAKPRHKVSASIASPWLVAGTRSAEQGAAMVGA